jgi:hypothetical protein
MDGLTLLEQGRAAGLTIESDGDRLIIRGPRRATDLAREILEHKAELVALLGPPTPPDWPTLAAQRWGPALDHDEPGIDVPADSWRWQVAHWPHARWAAWRDRSAAILPHVDPDLSGAAAIRAAEFVAYLEMTGYYPDSIGGACESCGDPAVMLVNPEAIDGECDPDGPPSRFCAVCGKGMIREIAETRAEHARGGGLP